MRLQERRSGLHTLQFRRLEIDDGAPAKACSSRVGSDVDGRHAQSPFYVQF